MMSTAVRMTHRSAAVCRRPSGNETSRKPAPSRYVDSKSWPSVHGSAAVVQISSWTNQANPVATMTLPVAFSGRRSQAMTPLATNDQPTSSETAISAPLADSSDPPAITAAAPMPAASAAGTTARRAGASVMGQSLGGIHLRLQPLDGPRAAGQPPVPAAEQRHRGGHDHGADERRVDQHRSAQPESHLLEHHELTAGEAGEDGDHDQRGAGDQPRGRAGAEGDARDGVAGRQPALADPAQQEYVVVHREAEQDREEEKREPRCHCVGLLEAEL